MLKYLHRPSADVATFIQPADGEPISWHQSFSAVSGAVPGL
ncbi:hypothetical protein [Lelliottia amnigena]